LLLEEIVILFHKLPEVVIEELPQGGLPRLPPFVNLHLAAAFHNAPLSPTKEQLQQRFLRFFLHFQGYQEEAADGFSLRLSLRFRGGRSFVPPYNPGQAIPPVWGNCLR
jgi:hypothetical protein